MIRAGLLALALLLSSCSDPGCEEPVGCADLLFHGQEYDEYRPIHASPPGEMQELGNATYPECNCAEQDLDGMAATDVWKLEDVDGDDAVIGIRQDSSTYVLFVRVGVDPESVLPPSP